MKQNSFFQKEVKEFCGFRSTDGMKLLIKAMRSVLEDAKIRGGSLIADLRNSPRENRSNSSKQCWNFQRKSPFVAKVRAA